MEALSLSFADRGVEEGWVDPAFPHSAESLGGTCQEIDGQDRKPLGCWVLASALYFGKVRKRFSTQANFFHQVQ